MSISASPPEFSHGGDDESVSPSRKPRDPPQAECCRGLDSDLSPHTRFRLLITLTVILLAFEIGGQMIPGPMLRLIETIACNNYWRRHDPARLPVSGHLPEHLCKISAVQMEVATVKGYSDFLEALLCL